jgi:hypothetical protein
MDYRSFLQVVTMAEDSLFKSMDYKSFLQVVTMAEDSLSKSMEYQSSSKWPRIVCLNSRSTASFLQISDKERG